MTGFESILGDLTIKHHLLLMKDYLNMKGLFKPHRGILRAESEVWPRG